ncbi:MAG: CoA transferase [Xanthobacteraceae bacterium]|nr:CoA transferase [Xanthobacteraceae bacterium]MBX3533453.1 CoA transferase [Xanthobacteraceae bacterium]MCW5676393.1 CoA transferase [Xanthobacteraceae bacterium]
MPGPLDGIKVLELARVLAGPWAGQVLSDLGADVIKIERPGQGDETRTWGPPYVVGTNGENFSAAYYHAINRGKRSVLADFTRKEDVDLVVALIREADVVLENYKVGDLTKFGLDYESVRKINPRAIYCSVTGFGQNGPYSHRPGYDLIIQAMGGIMDITGEPDREPMRTGVAYVDVFTGVYSAVGILSGLIARSKTGEGQHIDMSLMDVQTSVLANQALNYLVSGKAPRRMGNAHPNVVPYQAFETSDGYMIIAVGNDGQFKSFCDVLDLQHVRDDPRYASNGKRNDNRASLISTLTDKTRLRTREDLLAALEKAGVPAGPIRSIDEVFADPQVIARKMQINLPDNAVKDGSIPGVRSPILMSETPLHYDKPSPKHGEHSDNVRAAVASGMPAFRSSRTLK